MKNTIDKHTTKKVVKFYWQHILKYPFAATGIILLLPIVTLFNNFLTTLIVAKVIRRLNNHDYITGQVWQSFGHDIILFIVIGSVGMLLWRLIDMFVWYLEGNVLRDVAKEVFDHLINMSSDFHANNFSGSLVSNTNKILGSYIRIADTTMFQTIPLISSLVFTAFIMSSRAPLYVAVLLSISVFYIVVAFFVSKPVRIAGSKHSDAESHQTGYLADTVGNIMAVKGFAGEQHENAEYEKTATNTFKRLMGIRNAHMKQMTYFAVIGRTITIASFCLAIVSAVSHGANLATTFLIISYTSNITDRLFDFSNGALRNYNRSIGDAKTMIEILSTENDIKDPINPEEAHITRGTIRFKDVTFRHKGAEHDIFQQLNLNIKPGEKIGLIGHSGSGKTSLTRLLLRFNDINGGVIEIDGQDISKIKQTELRESISYVPQEPILFHRTIAENIAYGKKDATMQEIEAISKQSSVTNFVNDLPKGFETVVGERGVKLSGGQRQRIAIARAMLKNAPILVLDEATSALDSESEALIQDALWKLMKDRTAIVIAHRLSTIQQLDRIIVLEDGKLVEEGSHKYLLGKNGVYASLWNRQSGGFLQED